MAEAQALLFGLQLARGLGLSHILIEGDSRQVVTLFNCSSSPNSELGLLVENFSCLRSCFEFFH